jgi:Icc-related predicted phosphoesterase
MRIVHLFRHAYAASLPYGSLWRCSGAFRRLCRRRDTRRLHRFFGWLESMPHEHKILVAGNHDSLFQHFSTLIRKRVPKSVTYLEDSGMTIGGLKFWGSPWTPGYPWMAFTYRAIEANETRWSCIPNDTNILVTHGPPHGIFDRDIRGQHIGDQLLLERVEVVQPSLHLFGHVHNQNGRIDTNGTTFVNAAIGDDVHVSDLNGKICVLDV